MTDDLDQASQAGRKANRGRIRRITSGLQDEADALTGGTLVPKSARLAPAEHWQPATVPSEEAAKAQPTHPATASDQRSEPDRPAEPAQAAVKPARRRGLGRQAKPRGSRRTASWLNRLLIAIEVLAALGLVTAALVSFGLVDRLQVEMARFAAPPPAQTALPTPTMAPVVVAPSLTPLPEPTAAPTATEAAVDLLPGGRSSPQPESTRAPLPASLARARIIIAAIRVDAPIVEGDDWETLKNGVGHHPASALPGEVGNLVLSAHNDVYGAIFRNLGDLQAGDLVVIDTPSAAYRYQVTGTRIVAPSETSVMDPTQEPTVTLITCYPPLVDTHRIVVTAKLVR